MADVEAPPPAQDEKTEEKQATAAVEENNCEPIEGSASNAGDRGPIDDKQFTTNQRGGQEWLLLFAVSGLELYLSMENAIQSDSWRLASFTDHVFVASAVGEVLGFCLGLLMYFRYKKSSLLGLPLVNMSSLIDSKSVSSSFSFLGGELPIPSYVVAETELKRLTQAVGVLALVDIVFLLVFLWRVSVLAFGIVLAVPFLLALHSVLGFATLNFDYGCCLWFSLPALVFCLLLVSPPVLEMVEAGLLIFKAVKSDDFCGDNLSSTIVLAVLDFAIAAPIFFAGLGNAFTCVSFVHFFGSL